MKIKTDYFLIQQSALLKSVHSDTVIHSCKWHEVVQCDTRLTWKHSIYFLTLQYL